MPEQEDKLISGEFKSLGPPTREEAFNQYVTPQEELHGLSPADLEKTVELKWEEGMKPLVKETIGAPTTSALENSIQSFLWGREPRKPGEGMKYKNRGVLGTVTDLATFDAVVPEKYKKEKGQGVDYGMSAAGAVKGMQMGKHAGPYGALAGAVIGGTAGYFGSKTARTGVTPPPSETAMMGVYGIMPPALRPGIGAVKGALLTGAQFGTINETAMQTQSVMETGGTLPMDAGSVVERNLLAIGMGKLFGAVAGKKPKPLSTKTSGDKKFVPDELVQRDEFTELKQLEDQVEFWRKKTQSGPTKGERNAAKVKHGQAKSAVRNFIEKTIKAPGGDHAVALHFLEARADHWKVLSRSGKGGASTKGKRNAARKKWAEANGDFKKFRDDPGFLARESETVRAVRVSQVIRFGVEGKTEGFSYDTVQGLGDFYKRFDPDAEVPLTARERAASVVDKVRTETASWFRPVQALEEKVRKRAGQPSLPAGHDIAAQFETAPGLSGRATLATRNFDNEVVQPLYDLSPKVAGVRSKAAEGKTLLDFNVYLGLRRAKDRLEYGQRIRDEIKGVEKAIAEHKGITKGTKLVPEEKAYLKVLEDKLKNLKGRSQKEVGEYTLKEINEQLGAFRSKMNSEGAGRFETIVESGEAFQRHTDRALRLQVESGRLSEAQYQRIKEGNGFYAPFSLQKYNVARGSDGMGAHTGSAFDSQEQLTKAIEGINDPKFKLNEITEKARRIIHDSEMSAGQNEIMQKFGKMADADADGMFVRRLDPKKSLESQLKPGQKSVTVMVDGNPVHYGVAPEVADAIRFNPSGNPIETALRATATPFRAGATALSYKFQFRNLISDSGRAALISNLGIKNPVDALVFTGEYSRALLSSIRGQEFMIPGTGRKLAQADDWYKQAQEAKVLRSGILQMAIPDHLNAYVPLGKPANVLDSAAKFSNVLEESWKILGVQRALKMTGAKDVKTLLKNNPELIPEIRRYMGSPDFARFGKSMQKVNLLFMFSNARMQGTLSDLARANPADARGRAAWVRMGLVHGAPTAALWAYNYINHAEDLPKVPEKDRENNHIVFKDNYVTNEHGEESLDYNMVPKREVGKMFANGVEATLDFAVSKDPKAVNEWAIKTLENLSPINIEGDNATERIESIAASLHPGAKTAFQALLSGPEGRSWWQHRDLMSATMADASPREQYNERTPKAYVQFAHYLDSTSLGRKLPDQLRSPIMLEHIVGTWTASGIKQFVPKGELQGRSRLMNHPIIRTLAQGFVSSGYVENSEDRKFIKTLRREAADDTVIGMRESKAFFEARSGKKIGLVMEEAKVAYPKRDKDGKVNMLNIRMRERIADRAIEHNRGIGLQDKIVKSLPPAQRAKFIAKKLKGLPESLQRDYMSEYARKGLISEMTVFHLMQNAANEVEKIEGEFKSLGGGEKIEGEFKSLPQKK